jgi:predicted Zn-dependent peptidase
MPAVQRLFGAVPAGTTAAPTIPAPPAMTASREVFKVPGAQAQIFMSTLAPPLTHPDYPALKVMSAILGGGMASRFFSELRDQQALAYATAALYPPRLDTGSFVAVLGTGPDNVAKAEAALKDQLRRIQQEPASEQEVAIARSYVVGTQQMDRRTNARQAWYLAAAELAGLGHDYFDKYAAAVKKVTPADVTRVAKQYLGVVRTVIVHPN